MDANKRGIRETIWLVLVLALSAVVIQIAIGFSLNSEALAQPSQNCPCSFSELAETAGPSVVNISAVKTVQGGVPSPFGSPFGEDDPMRDFFEKFFGQRSPFGQRPPQERKQQGLGSGFVIDPDGLILTNNHVVEAADQIRVKLQDGKEYQAKIVGRDPKTDLALIKIEPDAPLRALQLGDSEQLKVGDWVMAIGSPFGLVSTVTAGIVSAKYRRIGVGTYDDFIQTDASINPGNSGGPLLNMRGEVVGVTTAIFSQSGGNIGIGFAIPSNMVRDLLPQLKKGKIVRGWLGVMIQQLTPQLKEKLGINVEGGALVSQVTPDSPADKAGIKRGDVIVSFDGRDIKEMNDLPYLVAKTEVGKRVPVTVVRKGEKKALQVTVGEMKPEQEAVPTEKTGAAPDLGLGLENLSSEMASQLGIPGQTGVVITRVQPGSAAEEAGLMPGDVIMELDQEAVQSVQGFTQRIGAYPKGQSALLLVNRKGNTLFLTITIPKG
ncbi:MAG: DegQ family serine endoprotease [Desulfobacteraceae bacterium]|nr:MAG: DegQ family serine endoprotease [Desulfobacteraceae bacterium]